MNAIGQLPVVYSFVLRPRLDLITNTKIRGSTAAARNTVNFYCGLESSVQAVLFFRKYQKSIFLYSRTRGRSILSQS